LCHTHVSPSRQVRPDNYDARPCRSRFLEVDPVEGGSANDYEYCNGDAVNCFDLSGTQAGTRDPYGTTVEKAWCLKKRSRARVCGIALWAQREANRLTVARFGRRGGRGYANAYTHIVWSALMTFFMGSGTAKGFGDRHEAFPGNVAGDMARWNNGLGRTVGAVAQYQGISRGAALSAFVDREAAALISGRRTATLVDGNF
jgi:hypothetical protein